MRRLGARRIDPEPSDGCGRKGPSVLKSAGQRPWLRTGIAFLALAWFCGCAAAPLQTRAPALAPQASAAWRARLDAINLNLGTLKLIGRLDLAGAQGQYTARVAWAMAPPDRLRIDLLAGLLPSASLASDGRHFYLRENNSGQVRSRTASNPSLEPILGLDVTVGDLLQIMAGRPPHLPNGKVRASILGTGEQTMLFFEKPWGGGVRVVVSSDGRELSRVEMVAPDGSLSWRVAYSDYRSVPPYRLPAGIEIADESESCTLRVDRIWVDAPLDAGIFILTGPRNRDRVQTLSGAASDDRHGK